MVRNDNNRVNEHKDEYNELFAKLGLSYEKDVP